MDKCERACERMREHHQGFLQIMLRSFITQAPGDRESARRRRSFVMFVQNLLGNLNGFALSKLFQSFRMGVQYPILKLKVKRARGLPLTELWTQIIAKLIGIISKLLHLIQLIHLELPPRGYKIILQRDSTSQEARDALEVAKAMGLKVVGSESLVINNIKCTLSNSRKERALYNLRSIKKVWGSACGRP
ncbi:hypothetical protein Cgig2_013832 [Carnegiea gigantea]|uniref:Uncharacterized protein n=1 Tax=Carnegiea gigantea TaxID=171969 RepID=A0A9Q1Q830_9CARY|nr:hypothetical protein Cgig2_013832 [Carnegiea gigantea]